MSIRRSNSKYPSNFKLHPIQHYSLHSTPYVRMESSTSQNQSAAQDIRLTRLPSDTLLPLPKPSTSSNSNTPTRTTKSTKKTSRSPTPLPYSSIRPNHLPPSKNLSRNPFPIDHDYDYDETLDLYPNQQLPNEFSEEEEEFSGEHPYEYIDDPNSLRDNSKEQGFSVTQAAKTAKNRITKTFSFHGTTTLEKKKHSPNNSANSKDAIRRRRSTIHNADGLAFSTLSTLEDMRVNKKISKSNNGHTVDVQVRTWVLEGNGSGLRKGGKISEWAKKRGPHRTVRVEANPSNLAQTVLYASDEMISSPLIEPYKETEFVTTAIAEYVDKDAIVYRDSKFEIFVVGMSISAQDFKLGYPDFNEALLYSLQTDSGEQGEETDSLPFVHYFPSRDDKNKVTEPDQFIPIPASRSLFMASDGMDGGLEPRKSVNCRFKILELEQIDDSMKMSLGGIEKLGSHVSQLSSVAPSLGLLSPALALTSTVTKQAIESHAKSDKVITTDINFLLAERQQPEINPRDGVTEIPFEQRTGEFLRYGYYFFLEKRVDAKLYASFRTFPNVSLMMRRMDKLGPNEPEFFPLTGVSYLVIRVTPRTTTIRATKRPIRMSHVQRLEDLMRTCLNTKLNEKQCERVVFTLGQLARDLGISGDSNKDNHDKETTESSPGRDSASS